jgi:hypothetical protein
MRFHGEDLRRATVGESSSHEGLLPTNGPRRASETCIDGGSPFIKSRFYPVLNKLDLPMKFVIRGLWV